MASKADDLLNNQPDAVLWAASQKGDETALRQLFARYGVMAESLCGGFQAAGMEREDLLQEAYIGLLKAIRSFQPNHEMPFGGFAALCMKRQLISAVRRQNAKKHQPLNESVPLEDSAEQNFGLLGQSPDPETAFFRQEEALRQRKKLTELLSSLEKQTLQCYLSGYSYEEMAKKLGCSEKTVDNALQRIRRKLRNL